MKACLSILHHLMLFEKMVLQLMKLIYCSCLLLLTLFTVFRHDSFQCIYGGEGLLNPFFYVTSYTHTSKVIILKIFNIEWPTYFQQ